MTRIIQWLKAAALASSVIVAAFACILLFQASSFLVNAQRQTSTVSAATVDLLQKYDALGANASKLVNDGRYSITEVNRNVLAERKLYEKQIPQLAADAHGVLSDVRTSSAAIRPLLDEATARTHDLAAFESSLTKATTDFDDFGTVALSHLDTTLGSADTLLANSSIPATLKNVAAMTATGDHMLFTFDAVETKATHDYLHPSKNPFVRTWKGFEPFLLPTLQIGGAVAAAVK